MEANAYDNNAEINHTWELKCQHCQSCQQCGLFRRLILDLEKERLGIVGVRQSSVFYFFYLLLSRHLQCLLSTGKGGWLCLKCLSSGPRQLRGRATSDCTCSSGLGATTIPQTRSPACLKLRVHGAEATAAPQLGAHFISTLKLARQRQQNRVLHASGGHFSSCPPPSPSPSPFSSSSLLAREIVVRLCLYFTLVWTFD